MSAQRRHLLKSAAGAGLLCLAGFPLSVVAASVKPDRKAALLVVDVQNCFLPGGTLPVKDGDQVIAVINRLAGAFDNIVITQDWHTPAHASFARTHAGQKPLVTSELGSGTQVEWPDL